MWHLGTLLSAGLGSAGIMAGFDDCKGLFHTNNSNNARIILQNELAAFPN